VADDLDPCERHGAVGVGGIDNLKLEPVGRQVLKCPLEVNGLSDPSAFFAALGRTSGAMLSQFPSIACLILVTSVSMPLAFG